MISKRLIVVILFSLALTGCATIGRIPTTEQQASFIVGKSTMADVMAALGKPMTSIARQGGGTTLQYALVDTSVTPQTLIPFVGYFIGGADSRVDNVMFMFDAGGMLIDSTRDVITRSIRF